MIKYVLTITNKQISFLYSSIILGNDKLMTKPELVYILKCLVYYIKIDHISLMKSSYNKLVVRQYSIIHYKKYSSSNL